MPNTRIQEILQQLRELNDELREHLREQQLKTVYRLKGKRVEFEEAIKASHKKLKTNSLIFLLRAQWRDLLSAPLMYGMVIPMLILDTGLFIYQQTCFRLYRIPRVKRSDYIVFDHQHLRYLNTIEKINCLYCSYGNGLFAYAREIGSLTEQYWCPIKHARKVLSMHERYPAFLEYGDAENFQNKIDLLRKDVIVSDK
jgi:hypothetical protein